MRILWTKKSQTRFQAINSHISDEFGEQSSIKFKNRVFDFLEILQRFPELGTLEVAEKNIRGFQISKQTRIFYRINQDHISLLTFFDSRQDPKKRLG